ncbi:hypothetical protein [Streptomyces niveus]|uniref:DUF4870 domain-containing protein n=1 Tax=Streptomyces niveus TaxID=193462 RepID=A0ABZ2A687_STRNV|nr:hypothetical protein [Streptomyces niveus]
MSFGDPNNPYGQQGQQQPQGQPGYGYPQQGQPQQPSANYGYPQAPPVQPGYGGGYPGGPTGGMPQQMPGGVTASRVFLWIISGLSLIGGVLFLLGALAFNAAKDNDELANDSQFQDLMDQSSGLLWFMTFIAFAWAVASIVLAIKFNSGGSGLRTALIVYGALTIVLGIYPFGGILGIVHIVLSILLIVFVSKSDGAAWFKRPRY